MAYKGAIGIDLGMTYSSVGVWQNDKLEIIANDQGNRKTPSCVAFTQMERLFGDAAMNQVAMNPTNTVFGAKRLIGRKFSDTVVQSDMKHWPFKVISDGNDNPLVQVQYHGETKTFRPEEIIAMVLANMKAMTESYLHKKVRKAVISVPQHFTQWQRQATKDAAEIAGLEVLQIINEPIAAAIAYGLNNEEYIKEYNEKYGDYHNVLIFDLGGGTFDVTLLTIDDGIFEVMATHGDTHLGGEDFDNRLVAHCIDEFKRRNNGKDMSNNQRALRRLRTACERAKRTLSWATQATIEIDDLFDNIDFRVIITRAQFEELCGDLFRRLMQSVQQVMEDWGEDKNKVHDVVLVGGSTRIPKVQLLLSDYFGGKELNNSINPDEAVVCGAAVWGFILTGGRSKQTDGFKLLLRVVTPHTIGIETDGGVMEPIIKRNTYSFDSHSFSTTWDNLTAKSIRVFEGESEMTKDCHFIGEFKVFDIQPAPRGETEIEFFFNIDANGILNIAAKKKGTDNRNHIDITYDKGRLSKTDIERMISGASNYKEQDKQQREQRVDAMKQLESTVSALKDNLNDPSFVAKLDAGATRTINEAIIDTLVWLYKNPIASKEEYELRNKELNELCDRAISECKQRVKDVIKQLENTISALKDNMNDSSFVEKLDADTTRIISKSIIDTQDWLYKNPRASKDEYELRNDELKKVCDRAISECKQRVQDVIKQLENTISALKDNMNDPSFVANLDAGATRTISKSIIDTLVWLYKNPMASKDEYELRNKELNDVYGDAISECKQRLADAMKQLENTISALKDNMNDPLFVAKLDAGATRTINEAIIGTQKWLDNNPMASKDEYELRNKELNDVYGHAISESKQRLADAMKQLENTISVLKDNMNDPLFVAKLDADATRTISKSIIDTQKWLDNNPMASKDEYELRNKELNELCDRATSESNQKVDAMKHLENTIFGLSRRIEGPLCFANMDAFAARIMNKSIIDTQEWLHKNPMASKDEYELRNKELNEVYGRATSESYQRVDAMKHLENTISTFKSRIKNPNCFLELDADATRTINEAIIATQEWLDKNPMASKDEYELRNKELNEVYGRATSERKQRVDAMKHLENTISTFKSRIKNPNCFLELDADATCIMNKSIIDTQEWLDKNPMASKDEYELRNKELNEVCERAISESKQRVEDAIKQLENTVSALKNNMNDPSFVARLDAGATRTIYKSIIDTQEWLYKNPMTSKDEYELRNKVLNDVYGHAISESKQRSADAMKQLENTVSVLKDNMNDPLFAAKLDADATRTISKSIIDTQEWLHKNPMASKDKYELRNKVLNEVCDRAISESNQKAADAVKQL